MSTIPRANPVSVLIVGAGPAGLSAAIRLKQKRPDLDVVVIDKAAGGGQHNLSGAVVEPEALEDLLNPIEPNWKESEQAKKILIGQVQRDDLLFLAGKYGAVKILPAVLAAEKMGLAFGQMGHRGDWICSLSRLTARLCEAARTMGVEVMHGFAAGEILWNPETQLAEGVRLTDQGLDKEGHPQPNFLPGEIVPARVLLIAEGCDGQLAEQLVQKAGLRRRSPQLFSLGVKELIKVSPQQYEAFGSGRVVHAMGYPLWTPLLGPGMFGGGIMYPMGSEQIAVGMIVGLDYPYFDFNPQDALTLFKQHRWVRRFIEGGKVVEGGAKMIPEGGFYALPRCPQTGAVGRSNVCLLGDSAGFVNMLKIKGIHNAVYSGLAAAEAAAENLDTPAGTACSYTRLLEKYGVFKEMESAKNFRQTVAKFGPLQGFPLSVLGDWLPAFAVEPDYRAMRRQRCRLKPAVRFDKDTFTAVAGTSHREEQPCHLTIREPQVCQEKCMPVFGAPCITFCPAGVYESIQGVVKPANPSNCLHCKTCQRKCPFDNIRWRCPEPGGGPKYKTM